MNLVFKNLQAYYIHPENYEDRTEALLINLDRLGVKSSTRIISNEKSDCKPNNITKAHLQMIEKVIEQNEYPCLILEDDIRFIKDLPLEFEVPDEADMIYIGGSMWNDEFKPDLYITEYNDVFYRVCYMYSAHAIIIANEKTALKYKEICENVIKSCTPHDIPLALISKDFILLTPKDGLYLYQDGYNQDITRFQWKDYENILLK
jgi:hypothetical protein